MLFPDPEAVGTLLLVEDVGLELVAIVLPHIGLFFGHTKNVTRSTFCSHFSFTKHCLPLTQD